MKLAMIQKKTAPAVMSPQSKPLQIILDYLDQIKSPNHDPRRVLSISENGLLSTLMKKIQSEKQENMKKALAKLPTREFN